MAMLQVLVALTAKLAMLQVPEAQRAEMAMQIQHQLQSM